MTTILYIDDTYCTSLNQLKKYFKNINGLSPQFCEEILTLQRDGIISLWLSEGDTEEEIQLSEKLNNLSSDMSNTVLLNSLTNILGGEKDVLPKLDYRSFFDIIEINCYQNNVLVNPIWSDSNENIYKIEPSYSRSLNTFCSEIRLTIDLKVKKVDNESFHIQAVDNADSSFEIIKSNSCVYSEEIFSVNDKHVGDSITVQMNSFIVGLETNVVQLMINGEVIKTLNLTKVRTVEVGASSLKFVWVKGGTFLFNNLEPITIDDFYITETPITQVAWKKIMGDFPRMYEGHNYPANYISYVDCQNFINKVNGINNMNFRLPTEEEWEYAAKGGNVSRNYLYSGSNKIEDVAILGYGLYPVASRKPNEIGLYDMSGLVREWCDNWHKIPLNKGEKSIRGGSYSDKNEYCETIYNEIESIDNFHHWLGFRLAISHIE